MSANNAFLKQMEERIELLEERLEEEKKWHIQDLNNNQIQIGYKMLDIQSRLLELKEQRDAFKMFISIQRGL